MRAQPVSLEDHFSQPAMFYQSLTTLEKAHVVEAFTFELGKVCAQVIKERELHVLANVDTDLCEQVAAGLGLPAPKGHPSTAVTVSAALTQILAEPGPNDGRKIGTIADSGSDLVGITKLVKSVAAQGVTALIIAPVGGEMKRSRRKVTVDRTLLTTRSIEFDALVVADGTTPNRRHQADPAATGSIPALQGHRRLGRRRRHPHRRGYHRRRPRDLRGP